MKITVIRSKGVGDLVMAVPIVQELLNNGHEIVIDTDQEHFEWLGHVFNDRPVSFTSRMSNNVRRMRTLEYFPYDYGKNVINLNGGTEMEDNRCANTGLVPVSRIEVYRIAAVKKGFIGENCVIKSPSVAWRHKLDRNGKTFIFNTATCAQRSVPIDVILKRFPELSNEDVVVDPHYPSKLEFLLAVATASKLIGVDSGALHVAELTGTPWTCLHTTHTHATRNSNYIHGQSIQSSCRCSPCYSSFGCRFNEPVCVREF